MHGVRQQAGNQNEASEQVRVLFLLTNREFNELAGWRREFAAREASSGIGIGIRTQNMISQTLKRSNFGDGLTCPSI